MIDKLEKIVENLEFIKELIVSIITFPKRAYLYIQNAKDNFWNPLEIATFLVILGLIIFMIDKKLGSKLIRYTIIIYFVYELLVTVFIGEGL